MALLASHPFSETSVGFLGKSDGLSELRQHAHLTSTYLHAEDGNVALIGEIALDEGTEFTVAYGFGLGAAEAAHHAYGALQTDFDEVAEHYVKRWREWQHSLHRLPNDAGGRDLYRISDRYERRATVVTTNLSFAEWVTVFAGDEKLTTALLDRLAHHATIITTKGKSYRMRKRRGKEAG